MNKIFSCVVLCIGCVLHTPNECTESVDVSTWNTQDWTTQEKCDITAYLQYLVFQESLGYTLFGSKPITLLDHPNCPFLAVHSILFPSRFQFGKAGWFQWKKLSKHVPSRNFVFLEYASVDALQVYLINKNACLDAIKNNLSDFRRVLKCQDLPKKILEKIISSKKFFKEGLLGSQLLYGILLGYGRNNALAFETVYSKRQFFYKPLQPFNKEDFYLPLKMSLPRFAVLQGTKETKLLEKSYAQQRINILNRYEKGDFLEITLRRLSQ